MRIRNLLVAVSTAALVASSTYGVLADSVASSASGVGVVSHGDQSSGSSVILGAGSTQEAKATPDGAAEAQSSAGGGGFAATFKLRKKSQTSRLLRLQSEGGDRGGLEITASIAGAHGGAHGWAWAGAGKKKPTDSSSESSSGGGGGSASLCRVTIKDWQKWRELKLEVRYTVLRCDCPTNGENLLKRKFCPENATEIFSAGNS